MSQRLASPHLDISAQTLLLSEGHAPTLRPAVTPYPLSCLQQGPPSDTPCNLLVYLFICLSPLLWNITPQVQEYVSILFTALPRGLKHCLPHSRHSISICWIMHFTKNFNNWSVLVFKRHFWATSLSKIKHYYQNFQSILHVCEISDPFQWFPFLTNLDCLRVWIIPMSCQWGYRHQ